MDGVMSGSVQGRNASAPQLQQVGGLVGGAAGALGGQALAWAAEGLLGQLEDVVAADRYVVAAALAQQQRLEETPQPVGLAGAEPLHVG